MSKKKTQVGSTGDLIKDIFGNIYRVGWIAADGVLHLEDIKIVSSLTKTDAIFCVLPEGYDLIDRVDDLLEI